MPATIYKGDLAEVTLGHETGIVLSHGAWGGLTITTSTSGDITTLTFSGVAVGTSGSASDTDEMFFDASNQLKYPVGMLAGCKLTVKGNGNFSNDDHTKGHLYTIVANEGNTIQVTPAMKRETGGSAAGDEFIIDTLGTPTIDTTMGYNSSPGLSDETVLTDQFIGLAATIALPETKVEVLRSPIVGVGRQVVVQQPQHIKNEGGSLETMMHSARWLYYALGNEAATTTNPTGAVVVDDGTNIDAIAMGDTYVGFMLVDADGAVTGAMPAVGDYITVTDTTETLTPMDDDPGDTNRDVFAGTQSQFHSSYSSEIRRVIAVDTTNTMKRAYVDDPFNFSHTQGMAIKKITVAANNATGSPNFDVTPATYGDIQNRQSRALWSMWHLPSFSLETSMRTRDVGSYSGEQNSNVPGSATDSKQLTRVYKGCKVKEWTLTAEADADVKMQVDFDALMCYTDTGRLEDASAATTTLVALSKTAGQANTRVLTLSDGTNSVNFSIDNSTATSTATVIAFSNANSNATQFATNIATAVNAAKSAGTLNMSASASSANVTLTQDNNGGAGNTTPSGTAISDSVITSSAFTGGNNPGDRYTAHRMFENIADSPLNRKKAGIAPNTEKPFFFYNGTITAFGTAVAQVSTFSLKGNNNLTTHLVVSGNPAAEARNAGGNSLEQIPFAGSRNPTLNVEGQTEFSLDMTILPSDPLFWHEFRTTRNKGYSEPIKLHLVKDGAGSSREEVYIIIDDYIIEEAGLQIPEDKGVIKQDLKILPRHVKVVAHDTLLHC